MSETRDLQSSTPEEYLDGGVLADEARLRDGPLLVEGHGRLSPQARVDDGRDLLFLLERLLLVSEAQGYGNYVKVGEIRAPIPPSTRGKVLMP